MPRSAFGHVGPRDLALFTDRYELSMLQGYLESDHNPDATFSLYFRHLPPDRGYAIAAGLEQVIAYVETLTFDDDALSFLADLGFDESLLSHLDEFEFTGEIRGLPEGTPVFPNEPLLEVTAPIAQAQLFETLVLNQIGYQTLVATKGARMADVVRRHGDAQTLVDFGSRRAHGVDAGLKAARAAYLGGFDGTSNILAGQRFGVPTYGTMAHSWVQSFESERAAFEAFADVYGDDAVYLIDTYDTVGGAERAVAVADDRGVRLGGVRLDSGDLADLSVAVDEVVDDADIVVSSGIDEYALREFFDSGGVADAFGPGTALTTSTDAPDSGVVYKLTAVERDGDLTPRMKLSAGKATYPGQKEFYRVKRDGEYQHDVLARRGEDAEGTPQLETIFEDGRLVYDAPDLDSIRARTRREIGRLPDSARRVRDPTDYEVRISDGLDALAADTERELRDREL
ncbi:nicotinate phosphoribosyltransferase [Natronoarchaeum philippinense]|uniref:nicotinate phosphoribosyltransferase n=1 Tax=Natronoarchaeum philippinense TaxID=558529 RepID=A0A285N4I8_NATPI|nr:nicotinate phosphoribosyltransferase [Natronoarchaeum philippinense]SNZ03737.1 nicotinate phosphoribosyltransferase [Natronoarchaeum philippinense]